VGGRRRWHQGANVATKAGGGATTAGGTGGGVQAGGRVIFLLWSFLPPLHPRGARACVLEVYVQRVRVEVNREVGVCLLTRRGGFLDCCSPVAVWRLFLLLSAAALFSSAPPLLPLRAFTLDPTQSLLERCVAAWMRRRCSGAWSLSLDRGMIPRNVRGFLAKRPLLARSNPSMGSIRRPGAVRDVDTLLGHDISQESY
jgi:hypothetical protein